MLIRKKSLKIQERLGMRIGVAYGSSSIPIIKTPSQAMSVLEEIYRAGFKALLLPHDLFSQIYSISDLYKEAYTDLLRIKTLASKYNIELAIHNPCLPNEPYLDEKFKIFLNISNVMDIRTFIIHPNFYSMVPKNQAIKLVIHKISEMVSEHGVRTTIGIETTGHINELGSIEDVIEIVTRTRNTEPILNWAHIHARSAGYLRSEEEFKKVINQVKSKYTRPWLNNAYFLFSGITYGPSGEIKHISFKNSDLKLQNLIKTIFWFGIKGTLIFETPGREKDIVDMLEDLGDMVR
jgi:deoxyribonuclease-4